MQYFIQKVLKIISYRNNIDKYKKAVKLKQSSIPPFIIQSKNLTKLRRTPTMDPATAKILFKGSGIILIVFGITLQFLFVHKLVQTNTVIDRNTPIIRMANYDLTYRFLSYVLIAIIALWLMSSVSLGISFEKPSLQKAMLQDPIEETGQLNDSDSFRMTKNGQDINQSRKYKVKRDLIQKYLVTDEEQKNISVLPAAIEPSAENIEEGGYTKENMDATLIAIGNRRALGVLHAALSKNYPINVRAATVLAELGYTNSPIAMTLIAALEIESSNLRCLSAEALGKIGGHQAITALISILDDADVAVQNSAVSALKNLVSVESVQQFLHLLKSHNGFVRYNAAQILGALRDTQAVGPLTILLKDNLGLVRSAAAQALGDIGDASAVEPLIALLKDKDLFVRGSALAALTQLGQLGAVDIIASDLKDDDSEVSMNAAILLGKVGDSRGLSQIIRAMNSADNQTRRYAAFALGKIKDSHAVVQPLVSVLNDSDVFVRNTAAQALMELDSLATTGPLIKMLHDRSIITRNIAASTLGKIGDSIALNPLIDTLKDSSGIVRSEAALALGKIGSTEAVESLINTFQNDSNMVRISAAQALGEIGDSRAVSPLIAALVDDDLLVRNATVKALGRIKDPRAIWPLMTILNQEKGELCIEAAKALYEITPALGQSFER